MDALGGSASFTHNPDDHDFARDWSPGGTWIVTGISDDIAGRAFVRPPPRVFLETPDYYLRIWI